LGTANGVHETRDVARAIAEERAQAIYWREMTLRIHLACCASLLRHADWLNTLLLAIESENFFGTLAACRGFLEYAADKFY
jgi:hypothetical protein